MWYDDTFAADDSLRRVADGRAANLFCFVKNPATVRISNLLRVIKLEKKSLKTRLNRIRTNGASKLYARACVCVYIRSGQICVLKM